MAATIEISETNGVSPGTRTNGITRWDLGTADAPNLNTVNHPIIIGLRSYMKWFQVHVAAMGGSSQIDTIMAWKASGTPATGVTIGTNFFYANPAASPNPVINAYATGTHSFGHPAVPVPYNGAPSIYFLINSGTSGSWFAGSCNFITAAPASNNFTIGEVYTPGGPPVDGVGCLQSPGYSDFLVLIIESTAATPVGPACTGGVDFVMSIRWNET